MDAPLKKGAEGFKNRSLLQFNDIGPKNSHMARVSGENEMHASPATRNYKRSMAESLMDS